MIFYVDLAATTPALLFIYAGLGAWALTSARFQQWQASQSSLVRKVSNGICTGGGILALFGVFSLFFLTIPGLIFVAVTQRSNKKKKSTPSSAAKDRWPKLESTEPPWETMARAAKEVSRWGTSASRQEYEEAWKHAADAIPLPELDVNASDRERIAWGGRCAEIRERIAEGAPEGLRDTIWNAAEIAMHAREAIWKEHNL